MEERAADFCVSAATSGTGFLPRAKRWAACVVLIFASTQGKNAGFTGGGKKQQDLWVLASATTSAHRFHQGF
jgi:hypothetical protein